MMIRLPGEKLKKKVIYFSKLLPFVNLGFENFIKVACILGPRINGLVTARNAKLCCRGFIFALFQSTTANKIDSEHT